MRLRQLEQKSNFMVEASVPTMILFCVKSAEILLIYINGRRFNPVAFISARFCMRITTLQSYVIFIGFIDIICSHSHHSVINNGRGFIQLDKVNQADGLETVGS